MSLLPDWPKVIKLSDVVDAVDQLVERLDAAIAERDAAISRLQHDLDEHKTGAAQRQAELDNLEAQVQRQAWAARTGRQL